jgi:pimeloyl-ACP methyl ester carboxylesterase
MICRANHNANRWRQVAPVILILGVLTMLATLQRHLIYFPSKAQADELSREAARIGLTAWHDNAGSAIGWKSTGDRSARNRILVFHGNAGYALHRDYFVAGFQALGDEWEVFLFEYPGYGAREGTPSAANFKSAAEQAMKSLMATDSRPIFVIGESLGSGIASYLAATFPQQVAGLLLVTPFSSLADVAAHHYPYLPVRTLLSERYDSVEALAHYRGPVAFLIAGRDEVVTTRLGLQLYNSYAGPKWLHVEAHAGHNTLPYHPGAAWWGEASKFLISRH